MPKLKTSKTMKKRVKLTATGKVTRRQATRAHKLTIKSGARKRAYTQDHAASSADVKNIKKVLGVK